MVREAGERWDAGYPRVSTDIQVERDALQNQVQALEAFASAHDLTLRLYPEAGVSAKDIDRPKLQELLRDVRAGRVRTVIVTKLDRISRSLADVLDLMRLFEAHGVKFVSLRDNIDTSGPVGRFMLHILGAIAELERGITAERVAEDMKLRARRGKWNGGLSPYGREVVDGRVLIAPEEAALLDRMRGLLLEKRSWRGVARALNREGKRTRGWDPVERDGRTVRKGKPPQEWTSVSVKRVLLQPLNAGVLVYNRRRVNGKTSTPRPPEEHVVVENFCEPIFTRKQMEEIVRVASEIEGKPPAQTGSSYVLSGLVFCWCGSRMYPVKNYVTTKLGRHPVVYYRCRRASHNGTCDMRQVPAAILEPLLVTELEGLAFDPARLLRLAPAAEAHFNSQIQPVEERRAALLRDRERLERRTTVLLELAEDRLIGKDEFVQRKAHLDRERTETAKELASVEVELLHARNASSVDIGVTLESIRRMSDIYDELEEVAERRHIVETCLDRVVVGPTSVEFHIPTYPAMMARLEQR
ncbi:MAG: hypothetical protein GEU75_17000 [Dehalococcoidia bacterium]|nr:hypothetical protein [Dehalococcoidia bacterium]